ncbi:MAG: hypothetical protein ACUVV0_12255 [Anaerolineae bacterium]
MIKMKGTKTWWLGWLLPWTGWVLSTTLGWLLGFAMSAGAFMSSARLVDSGYGCELGYHPNIWRLYNRAWGSCWSHHGNCSCVVAIVSVARFANSQAEVFMSEELIEVEVWLYGEMKKYGGEAAPGYAVLRLSLPKGTTMRYLLKKLGIPLEEKGITFINSQLTDMPGLLSDIDRELEDGDHIGLFSPRAMWPFQYRFGAPMASKLKEDMRRHPTGAVRHSFG